MSALSVHITRTVAGLLVVMSMILTPVGTLAAPPEIGETVHIVQLGETLSSIAGRYGVTVEVLMAANDLVNPNYIYVGQRLVIPTASGGSHGEGGRYAGRHVVKVGETLTSIAFRYGTTVAALAAANGLRDADFIYVGQVLNVPGSSSPAPKQVAKPGPVNTNCAGQYGAPAQQPCTPCTGQYNVPAQQPCTPNCTGQYDVPVQQPCTPNCTGQYDVPSCAPGSGAPATSVAPAPPPAYQATPAAVSTEQTLPPGYTPPTATAPSIPAGITVVPATQEWIGSQTASNPDPDGITTLLVMTHDAKDLDMTIYSTTGFAARGYSGVYFEYSWIPTFAFRGIPGGDYQVWISGKPSQLVKARVDPGFRTLVEFHYTVASINMPATPSGWIGEVTQNSSGIKPLGVASILVIRTGAIGNKIRVTAGTYEGVCITGTKIELGPGACEIGGLTAGTYRVFLDGTDIAVDVYLDGRGTATVEFRHT